MTGVKKVERGDVEGREGASGGEEGGRPGRMNTNLQEQIRQKTLVKNESKGREQPGPAWMCPERPRGAARPTGRCCNRPARSTPAATALFRNLPGLRCSAPTARRPGRAPLGKAGCPAGCPASSTGPHRLGGQSGGAKGGGAHPAALASPTSTKNSGRRVSAPARSYVFGLGVRCHRSDWSNRSASRAVTTV